jgi:polysaccharide biosynthesis transport protein
MPAEPEATAARSFEPLSLNSTVDLLEMLWRRWRLGLAGMLIAAAAGLAYYFLLPPTYESSANVLLVQKRAHAVTGSQDYESSFDHYVATHRALIVSPLIINRAVEAADLGSLETFAGLAPEWELLEMLTVHSGPRDLGENADSIMTLVFAGPIPEECPIVVQAILDSYKAFLDETYRDMSDNTLRLIAEARDLLQNDLQRQEDTYVQFRQQSPLVTRGTDEVNPLQDRLTAIETQRTELLIRRAEIEGQLQAIQIAQDRQADAKDLLALVTDLRSQQTSDTTTANVSTSLDNQILQLADREQELLEHFGPNHPRVVTIRQRIAAARQLLALPSPAYVQESGDAAPEPGTTRTDAATVQLYLQSLQQELDRIKVSEQLLTELYQREHDAAKELSGYQLKDEGFRRNIDRTQQLYDGIISQLQEAGLVKDFGGFDSQVIAEPVYGEQVSPSKKIAVAGSLLGGLGLGMLMAVFAELKDKSFHSRQEIQSRLGLAVFTEVPHFKAAGEAERRAVDADLRLDPMLCTHFQRRSLQAEAFRSLRTTVLVNHRSAACRVIQLTSPSPGDGKSTIAANLAVSLAQLGRRVLLVDADIRQPRQHQIFGITADQGLGAIAASPQAVAGSLYATEVDGLSLLPVGPDNVELAEFFASKSFEDLLSSLRARFEYVLIDSEPLLAASDPCVIAAQADGVLLVLRANHDSRWRADRAKELLETIGVRPLGVVVNGIGGPGSRGYTGGLSDYEHASGGHNRERAGREVG